MSSRDHGRPAGKVKFGRRKEGGMKGERRRKEESREREKMRGRRSEAQRKGSGSKTGSLKRHPHLLIVAFHLHGPGTP